MPEKMTAKRLQQIDDFLRGPHKRAFYGQSMLLELRAELARANEETARLTTPPDVAEWKELVDRAYRDGGDGARRIDRITAEYNRARKERDTAQKQLAQSQQENKELRKWLWLRHGHDALYGDDGEMQCGRCVLDFKRQPVAEIADRFQADSLAKWKESQV